MKLNNKGFAISAVLYSVLILFMLILVSYLTILSGTKKFNTKTLSSINEVMKEEVIEINKILNDKEYYLTTIRGNYLIELGNKNCYIYLSKNMILVNKDNGLYINNELINSNNYICNNMSDSNNIDNSIKRLEDTKNKIEADGGAFAEVIADLSDMASIDVVMKAAIDTYGRVDILVNNAGIIKRQDAIEFTEENWDSVIQVNQKMVFFLSQAFAKQLMKQGEGGKIINVCSMLSYQGGIRVPSYTASKSAIIGLTRALANEWAKYNINVNGIAPGYMATNNTAQLRDDADRSEAILDRIPAGRWGTPQDMEGAVIYLASKASDYVNGFTLAVDGGWLAR